MGAIILKSHLSYPGGTFLKHILWRHRRDEAYLWDISVLEERTGRLLAGRLLHDEPWQLDGVFAKRKPERSCPRNKYETIQNVLSVRSQAKVWVQNNTVFCSRSGSNTEQYLKL